MTALAAVREINVGEELIDEYQTRRGPIRIVLPRYVRACRRNEWRLHLWEPGSSKAKCVPYRCRSWRCAGDCRNWRAKYDMRRIMDALRGHDPSDVCFFVLTLDRNGTMGGKPWPTRYHAFLGLSRCARILLKRLNRALRVAAREYDQKLESLVATARAFNWTPDRLRAARDALGPYPAQIENRWVGTCEQHRSGWPHYNLIVVSPYLAQRLSDGYEERRGGGLPHHEAIQVQGLLRHHVVESGFGQRSTGEAARNLGDVAHYIVKAASIMEDAVPDEIAAVLPAEVSKMSQVPEAAPKGFRRIRSGIRFLPPKRKSGWTGVLLDRAGNALGGRDPLDQLVGLLGPWLNRARLPQPADVTLDPFRDVLTSRAEARPELPGPAGRHYQIRTYDPRDPQQQVKPAFLVPDPTGDDTARMRIGDRIERIRVRVEPKPLLVIDFTIDTS